MLSYLFLLAAAAAPTDLPTTDITDKETPSFAEAMESMQEIQELVAILAQEETASDIIAATAPAETTSVADATPIIIANAIEPSMLEYKHWTGKYSPEIFTISVNGTQIEQGKTIEVPATTKTVEIRYDYSFMNGIKSGGKTISYELNENITQVNITFSWKDDWRVLVDNGVAVKEVTI